MIFRGVIVGLPRGVREGPVCTFDIFKLIKYNELSQKNWFQSVLSAALCLYNIQRENLVFNSLCTCRSISGAGLPHSSLSANQKLAWYIAPWKLNLCLMYKCPILLEFASQEKHQTQINYIIIHCNVISLTKLQATHLSCSRLKIIQFSWRGIIFYRKITG